MVLQDRLIIGVTGSLGSGVLTAAKYLVKKLGSEVYRISGKEWDTGSPELVEDMAYKLSTLIEEEAENRGEKRNSRDRFDRKLLQRIGNEMRQVDIGCLAKKVLERINHIEKKTSKNNNYPIIVDGIKNSGEVEVFRKHANFFLFAIDAYKDKRWNRVEADYEGQQFEFEEDDERDHDENIDYGQQVDKCVYLSDILFNNDSDIKKELYDKIDNYIDLIQKKYYAHPTPCEIVMTHAYTESLKSSCLKRKVGAVLVGKDGIPLISTCNEVPKPEESCKKKFGMCYRDKIKIDLIKNLRNCPNCGAEITQTITCPKCKGSMKINDLAPKCSSCKLDLDLDSFFVCKNCKSKIIKEFIGKRSEVCRALHAEERVILHLAKLGMGISLADLDITLYTTTFPCPQCANKIVDVGINKLVFVEPYPAKESKDLLKKSLEEKNIDKFEGVKARTYFRAYDVTR